MTEYTNGSNSKTCAHPGVSNEGLVLGSVTAGYVVEAIRGHGGFATVYRARHEFTGATVALKVLYPHLTAPGSGPLLRFVREIEMITRLHHPNIVNVLDSGEVAPGRPFYVMEWLEGTSLDEQLRNTGPFSVAEALALLDELASALAAAHELGIVHRDIKASNVMLVATSTGRKVKLLDFGIAKLLDKDASATEGLTSTGSMIGTPYYMAPEQICSLPVDARTDIYSLGILLYELVTGQLPFVAATTVAVADMHLHAPPPRACDIAPVSARVDAVIERCLKKRPADRYGSIAELRAAMREAAQTRLPEAQHGQPSTTDNPATSVGHRRPQTIVPALVVRVEVAIDEGDGLDDTVLASEPDLADEDRMLDDLDNVMAIARREFAAAALQIGTTMGNLLVGTSPLPIDGASDAERTALLRQIAAVSHRIVMRPDKHPKVVVTVLASLGRASADETGYAGDRPRGEALLATRAAVAGIEAALGAVEIAGTELMTLELGR